MGDDTPPAALSKLPRPLFHYFKQRFAEVTNPPIDPLREEMVMSTRMLLGRRANLLSETPEATRLIALKSPVLLPEQMAALRAPDAAGVHVRRRWTRSGRRRLARTSRRRMAGDCVARGGRAKLCRDGRGGGAQRRHHPGHQRRAGRRAHAADSVAAGGGRRAPPSDSPGAAHARQPDLRHRRSHARCITSPRSIGYGANAVYPYLAYATDRGDRPRGAQDRRADGRTGASRTSPRRWTRGCSRS